MMQTHSLRSRAALAPLIALALALSACGGPAPGGPGDPDPDPDPTGVTPAILFLGDDSGILQILHSTSTGIAARAPLVLPEDAEPCGSAAHDGRLYVGDYWNEVIYAYDLEAAIGGGVVSPLATATPNVSGIVEPCGLAFDSNGDLWVGDFSSGNRVLTFTDPATWSGDESPTPSRILTMSSAGSFQSWVDVVDVAFDDDGNLWVVDEWYETITRIDDPTSLPADATNTVPSLQIVDVEVPPSDGLSYSLYLPNSVAIGPDGMVYVGNDWSSTNLITRYDDVGLVDTTGQVELVPGAYIVAPAPLTRSFSVGFDPDGRLWVADRARLHRLTGYTGDGVVNAGSGASIALAGETTYYGGMTWVAWSGD